MAQAVLGGPSAGGAITIAWSFGVGITLGVFVSGNISGKMRYECLSESMNGYYYWSFCINFMLETAVSAARVYLRKLSLFL